MNKRVKRVIDYIGSRRFAVILLIITTSIILTGNLLPNTLLMSREEAQEFAARRPALYQFSKTFHVLNLKKNPFFLIIPGFIFLSVTICTYRRINGKLKEIKKRDVVPSLDYLSTFKRGYIKNDLAVQKLERMGWNVTTVDRGECRIVYGRKGDFGIVGSIAFHFGLDIVVIGILVSIFTQYNGKLMLTEGFETDPPASLEEAMSGRTGGFPYKKMLLESFETVYKEGKYPVDHTARLKFLDRNDKIINETIKVNEALTTENFQFTLDKSSYSPRFIITEKNGKEVVDAFVNLLVPSTDKGDYFDVPGIGIRIQSKFFPDYFREGDMQGTRSFIPKNPVFLLEFYKDGKRIGAGLLPLNKRMDFDDGRYTIHFAELRRWVTLSITRDAGLPLVAGALLIIVAGLVARFIYNEKSIWIVFKKEGSYFGGRAAYFPALFEAELGRISEEIGITEDKTSA